MRFVSTYFVAVLTDGRQQFTRRRPEGRAMAVEFVGAWPFEPPTEPMSGADFARLICTLPARGVAPTVGRVTPQTVAGVRVVADPPTPRFRVQATVEAYAPDGVPRSIAVRVSNDGPDAAGVLAVWLRWQAEAPQPIPGYSGLSEVGAGYQFVPAFDDEGALHPFESRLYVLDERLLPSVRSLAAALSPERYGIVVTSVGRPVARVGGSEVGELVEGIDG